MLLQLQVENFKSYAGQQVIGPFKTLTCIIGPNGAGKSNVMDAISFVLGVRSSQLRSSQLKDLIYRRSTIPSPDDPTSAHVEAVIVVKGKHVHFKRCIMDNGGSSNYRIDGRVVSWQRYNERLQTLNILVKARNFLVFQGDVESVASQNSRDLMKLFEQISGSAEFAEDYDRLKDQQEKATTNSIFNLNKKKGLTAEIKQYEEQKNEAQRYEQLLLQKSELVQSHILYKLFHIERDLESVGAQILDKTVLSDSLQRDYTVAEGKFKLLKVEQAKLHKEILKTEKLASQKGSELEKKRPELIKLNEQISHADKKVKRLDGVRDKLAKDLEKQRAEVNELQGQLDVIQKASRKFDDTVAKTQSSNVSLNEVQLLEYQKLRKNVDLETSEESVTLEEKKRAFKAQEMTWQKLQERLAEWKQRLDKLDEDRRLCLERRETLSEFIASANQDKLSYQKQLDFAIQERKRLDQTEVELEEKLAQVYGDLSEAKYDKKESERQAKFKESIETIMRLFSGVHGRVSDLCDVKNRRFELAVSVVLGKNLDSIVVDDDRVAMECIEFMKQQQSGVATFLPLNSIHAKPVAEKFRSISSGARLALDCLEFDTALTPVFEYACGSALICDTLEVARDICYNKKQSVKAVTVDGTVIHKSGMITGGVSTTSDSGNGKPSRWEERKVELLHRSKKSLETQLQELVKEKHKAGNIEELRSNLNLTASRLASATEDFVILEKKLESLAQEHSFTFGEMKSVILESDAESKILDALKREIAELDEVIRQVENRAFKAFCSSVKIRSIREYEGDRLRAIEEMSDKKVAFSTQISKLTAGLAFASDQLDSLEKRLASTEESLGAEAKLLSQLQEQKSAFVEADTGLRHESDEIKRKLMELKRMDEEKSVEVNTLKRTLQSCQKELDHLSKEIVAIELQIEKFHSERISLFRKCKLEGVNLPCTRGSLDNVIQDHSDTDPDSMDVDESRLSDTQISQAIHINYDTLNEQYKRNSREITETHFLDKIEAIIAEAERMAPNMKAVERLDGAAGRLNATNEEFEQARHEAKTTRENFNKVKKSRHDKFYNAFNKISEKIDIIYKELTKSRTHPLGGTAYLTLENPEEPYLEGIKYHAMPPMKRFRDMDQLSGGEKTMAALALLLAVHSFHPSPFFVLDEVDAALDNANVAKLAEYLVSHARDDLQFIVISLKSSLYEKADGLVGVYRDLAEKTSKLLTLDLSAFEE